MRYIFFDRLKRTAVCDIQIKKLNKKVYVCATELKENPGGSITNNADELYTKLLKDFSLKHNETVFLERYTHESYQQADRSKERVSRVEFNDDATFRHHFFPTGQYKMIFESQ